VFNGNTALTGSISGEVYKWTGGAIIGVLKNHTKLVDAITVHGDNLYTGGRDSKIFIYNKDTYALTSQFDLM
jgi:WD40 repeat protein